jgi:acetylornithine deacetylase/succinyl-diaminopimelate desuccinylase-like protein
MTDKKTALTSISAYVDAHEDEIVDFLKDFIAIRSVTYEEGGAVEFFAGKLREFGFDEVRVDAVGNVLGRVGSGKTTLLYDAHIDTVEPGNPDAWGMDPLKAELADGVLRGRGAVDDKGCLTAIAFAGRALRELELDGEFTLWISGSISEEDVEGACVDAMMKESTGFYPCCGIQRQPDRARTQRPRTDQDRRAGQMRACQFGLARRKRADQSASYNGKNRPVQ